MSGEYLQKKIGGCAWCNKAPPGKENECPRSCGYFISHRWFPNYWCLACGNKDVRARHPTKNLLSSSDYPIEDLIQLFDQACEQHDRKLTCSMCQQDKLVRYGDEIKKLNGRVEVFEKEMLSACRFGPNTDLACGKVRKREFSSLSRAQIIAQTVAQATESIRGEQRTREQFDALKQKHEALLKRTEDTKAQLQLKQEQGVEENMCVVCLDAPKKMIVVPCGHHCLCVQPNCFLACEFKCPICRKDVSFVQRVWQ